MSFLLTRDATYDSDNLSYVLTPSQPNKTGSMISTGVAPCMNYKSYYDVLLDTPVGTGTGQMTLFFCQVDAETSVEVGVHHNATSKSMTLSLSKVIDGGETYSQAIKYVDNVDVTTLITYGQKFSVAINHCYGTYEAFINEQPILKGSSDVVYGLETGHFEVLAKTLSNVYGKQTLVNYGVDPIFTVAQDLDVFGTVNASSYNIALCEDDLKIHVPVGSIVAHIGNEYIGDPTMANIVGQTVNRVDYIDLANALGIPTSQATFVVPALKTEWTNVVNKPTYFQADWESTVINKPSQPFTAADFWNCCPVGVIMIWSQTTLPSAKWAWCDGLNGTVDLTGRAPIGATKYSNFANPLSTDYQRWFNNPGDQIGSGSTYLSDVQIPAHKLYFTDTHSHTYDYRYGSGSTDIWHEKSDTRIAPAGGGGGSGTASTGTAINAATVAAYTNGQVYRASNNTLLTTTTYPVPVPVYQPSAYVLFIQKIVA